MICVVMLHRSHKTFIEELDSAVNPLARPRGWEVRPFFRPRQGADVAVVARQPAPAASALAEIVERIERTPSVARARAIAPNLIYARFSDSTIATNGELLEAGVPVGARDLARGRRFVVHFGDPNATKPLHLGHLRNLAIGNALACALRAAGAEVETRCVVADIGRSVAEAMAGIWPERNRLSQPYSSNEKEDHFVGRCYARYVAEHRDATPVRATSIVDAPLAREVEMHNDLADVLLARLLAGDPEVVATWRDVRQLVLRGHSQTFDRLGVRFDRIVPESELTPHAVTLIAYGLHTGLFEKDESGIVRYVAGREDNASLPLMRQDGAPTQHLRTIAYWNRAQRERSEAALIRVSGDEWRLHTACSRWLLPRLPGQEDVVRRLPTVLFHGMVTTRGSVLKSSDGASMLIDDLLDWLEAEVSTGVAAVAIDDGHATRRATAARVALAAWLTHPRKKTLDCTRIPWLADGRNLGWQLTVTNAHAVRANTCGRSNRHDPAYRFAVVQAQQCRVHLRLVLESLDTVALARHLLYLAHWSADARHDERVRAVVRTAVAEGAAALGLAV
jgi:arginyl-tRNA synthetase